MGTQSKSEFDVFFEEEKSPFAGDALTFLHSFDVYLSQGRYTERMQFRLHLYRK